MKIDISKPMIDAMSGEPMKSGVTEAPLTLKLVMATGLQMPARQGETITAEDHVKRFKLVQKVMMDENEIELSSEEIVLIKGLIAKAWSSPAVAGQAIMMIEP